ncbi:KTSC domain-containing protein [Scopulibacillus darangshiensis]|uniref:KTSC domain-containing protein n=1 Tax=Scopulibacillus darangshiensis TaxID=442528 RepID=A0A4R2PB92_9BACL|nr:KTSC domain-containing protein [Scopulibacillus darangshiensis]TCP32292.1 KTSC domain-containing protein [Scopulibacillus darangshiensis]
MNYAKFDKKISTLVTFDTIGYDRETEKLQIKFYDGTLETYADVPEEIVFAFLLSFDKEAFYKRNIKSQMMLYGTETLNV